MKPFLMILPFLFGAFAEAPVNTTAAEAVVEIQVVSKNQPRIYYGVASFYADKFAGRKTASGEVYQHSKLTAACNVLPLGTWIRVTNTRNNKFVIVRVNDRLHPKNKRIVDLSKVAAEKIGYINSGLTKVKVEVLGKVQPKV